MILTIVLIGLVLFQSCSDGDEPIPSEQLVTFELHRASSHYDHSVGEYVSRPNAWGYGQLVGDPIPSINYISLNQDTFSDQSDFRFDYGSINLGTNFTGSHIRTFDDVEFVTVEVSTSEGSLIGQVSLPDSVKNIQPDTTGALKVGTSVSVKWDCAHADYFEVGVEYYDTMDYSRNSKYWFGLTMENSFSLPGVIYNGPGRISQIKVTGINGSIPAKGMSPNMVGSGYGYLSYIGDTARHSSDISFYIDD